MTVKKLSYTSKVSLDTQNAKYMAALGLPKDPFSARPDPKFYFEFDSFAPRLKILQGLVRGTDHLVLIMGEAGSGKTSLLNRYLATGEAEWKPIRIQTDPQKNADNRPSRQQGPREHPAYITKASAIPILILDDAHLVPQRELTFLLRKALVPGSTKKTKRLVLLGEAELYNAVTWLTAKYDTLPAVNKIYLTGLTEAQTAAYLKHRLKIAGYLGKDPFNPAAVKKIHQTSGGNPGLINEIAHQWLNDKYANKKEGQIMLKKLPVPTGRSVAWGAAGFVILLMVALWLFSDRRPWHSKSLDQQDTKMVFRKKIRPGSQVANNVVRKKIAAVKTPSVSPPKTETKLPDGITASVKPSAGAEAGTPDATIASVKPPAEAETEKPETIKAAVRPSPETAAKSPDNMIASVQTPIKSETSSLQEIGAADKPTAETEAKQPEKNQFSTNPSPTVAIKQPLEHKTVSPETAIAVPTKAKPAQVSKLKTPVPLTQQSSSRTAGQKTDNRSVQRERWILNQDSRFYTVQIIGVHNEQSLSDFVQKYSLLEKNDLAYYKSTFNGKAWYQLLYGVYPTKKDAEVAAGKLPEKIVQAGPWIRKIAKVQEVIRRNTRQKQ